MKNISDIIKEYISLRSDLDAARKVYKEKELEVKQRLIDLELEILDVSNTSGVNSFKTEYGTAYKVIKKYATMKDRDAAISFAMEKGDYGIFTNHVNKAHVIELLEEGIDPSTYGVEYSEEAAINVKKS